MKHYMTVFENDEKINYFITEDEKLCKYVKNRQYSYYELVSSEETIKIKELHDYIRNIEKNKDN